MENNHFSDQILFHHPISEDQRERVRHGAGEFPCAWYLDHYHSRVRSYPWHWHDEFEIAYVTEGNVTAYVNDQQILLEPGDGLFINPRTLHAYAGQGEAFMPDIVFHPLLICGSQESVFWERYVRPLVLSPAFSHRMLRRDIPWQADVLAKAESAFQLLRTEDFGYEFSVRSMLSEILLELSRHMPEDPGPRGKSYLDIERVRQMLLFIELHYTEPIQVQQIADSAYISRRECMRSFQRIIGTSPIQYVIELRIRKARRLLAETDLPVLEVCTLCGFQNQSYFTKTFREKIGTSPVKYRNTIARGERSEGE